MPQSCQAVFPAYCAIVNIISRVIAFITRYEIPVFIAYHDEGSRGNNKNEIQVHGDDSRGRDNIGERLDAM